MTTTAQHTSQLYTVCLCIFFFAFYQFKSDKETSMKVQGIHKSECGYYLIVITQPGLKSPRKTNNHKNQSATGKPNVMLYGCWLSGYCVLW